ncbi:MAG: hypothetical protein HOB40_08330 [Candidatus Marinimicrobia bacterium]|jgi:hypothetical protein|nr:hypothetical protein [Candidatus Neomarinimicrobiota bacterium]MBT3839912.1 hypothetical protein [Candidatus Neomarinimicrobiota bacterium]MBT3998473.1 hypothetical protein [Candidatus Neomarinimicrobiota bacterium]MBT4281709.1 hypothetical protein [Candidatus Neomarinimicrobiota bacterium]MBT4579333.1 hypothetical protein [Candidatus Neomarinimicrobiota bacterium]
MIKHFILFLLVIVSSGRSQIDPTKKYEKRGRSVGKVMSNIDRKYGDHSGNRVLCRFYNYGGIGDLSNSFSGVYPIGSGHAYFYEFTPVIAASVIDENGNRKHIVSDGAIGLSDDNPETGVPWSFEPLPGYADPNQEVMAMSDNEVSWPASWPNRAEDWDGLWNGQYGKYTRADQESYYVMDDFYNNEFLYFPDSTDIDQIERRGGLGIELDVRGYQWNHPAAEDIIIVTYWITNVGTSTLDSVVFGMYGDADIGGSSDFNDDDAWFDVENDMVFQWDHNGWSNSYGGFKPVYFGWSFLESPGNPTDGIDNDDDGMIDESQFDGIDNDGDWDLNRDDIGADGLAEYHINYPGPDDDGTEGNGVPDVGEPNFEITDNDESDQIGLTSFYSAAYPSIQPDNDEVMWNQLKPGIFQVPAQNIDQTFLYGSAYISLAPGEKKKFSVAMVFGENMADIVRNANTMQHIYDNDYSFAKPPLKPTMTAVPGNNKVTLYWDDFSEISVDPIYGNDFEGYRIYRSTDPGFIDSYTITDAYGNITFKEPIAIFDIENGLKGPHPIGFNGVQFDMGEDTGLKYIYTDSNQVINGQTYYYSVTAFDKGYDLDFFEKGFSERENLKEIAPSECSVSLDLDYKGNVVSLSENAAIVVPNGTAIGYVPPNTLEEGNSFLSHISGYGSGAINIDVVDPYAIKDNNEYHLVFDTLNSAEEVVFNIRNQKEVLETLVIKDSIARASNINIYSMIITEISTVDTSITGTDSIFTDTTLYDTTFPVKVTNQSGSIEYQYGLDYTINAELGFFLVTHSELLEDGLLTASYNYFTLFHETNMDGGYNNPIFDGMRIVLEDSEVGLDDDSSRWTIGNSNYRHAITPSRLFPADFEIQFEGNIGDSITIDSYDTRAPFRIKNVTHNDFPPFRISDYDRDDEWDPDEPIMIRPYDGEISPLITIRFYQDSLSIMETTLFDTIITGTDTIYTDTTLFDTTILEVIDPVQGDIFKIAINRPFSVEDIFSFTSTASSINPDSAKNNLDAIAVVPNPYVVAASWEPRHIYQSGRGPRKIDFINLPSQCTIKIFTLAGYLVNTIEHNDVNENGTESWNLLSKDGLEISFGVYLYHVDAFNLGIETTGKFAVIK